ncbi:MAG: MarR family winged helix-turn-helix transcriptional regulator [Thermodesulfobacteriota bacterium]
MQSDRFGLPPAEIRALVLLGTCRYQTAKELAQAMGVVKSRITAVVDGLEKRGMVRRVKDPADSRVVLVSLTPEGRHLHSQLETFMDDLFRRVMEHIESDRRDSVLAALDTLAAGMKAVKEEACGQ